MKAPANGAGFVTTARLVAAKDLRLEWRTLDSLAGMLLFALIVLVVYSFAFDGAMNRELGARFLIPGILWTVVTFSGLISFSRAFQNETADDTLTALRLAPVDRGAIYTGKLLAVLVKLAALETVTVPLTALFFSFDLAPHAGPLVLVLVLHTVGLAVLGTLTGAIAARVGRGEALTAILLLPAAAPLLISAVETTGAVLGGEPLASIRAWLLGSLGFAMLFFCVAVLTFDYVLEE
ncbi:hypothetical protein ABI59_02275 [Acidobacteria bacterium Mor1]|nr:hypothetical protein ABI59_02275 [Acidobacteria bacterium Mor1]